jgi:hypothetical protein
MNGNGTITNTDILLMWDWIYHSVPPPMPEQCADVDGHEGVTIDDPVWVVLCVVSCEFELFYCDSLSPPYTPAPTGLYQICYPNRFPAGDSSVTFDLTLARHDYMDGMTLPMEVRVDGAVPLVEVIETGPEDTWIYHTSNTAVPGASPGHALLGYHRTHSVIPDHLPIARFRLTLPAAGVDRTIELSYAPLPPSNVPVAVRAGDFGGGMEPQLFPCQVTLTGDVDESSTITSADVIYLINFIFKSGLEPVPCEATADANCDGLVTAADVIWLINFTFKGGTAPCNACTLVGDGVWACP